MAYSIATWNWTPDTWSGEVLLEEPKVYKYLLKSNGVIYSIDESGNLLDVTSQIADINNITQLEYETLGFDNMSLIDITQLGNLQSPKSVIYYTDDTTITNPKLKHEYSFNIGTRLLKRG